MARIFVVDVQATEVVASGSVLGNALRAAFVAA